MNPSVYVETTVVSYYTAKPSTDIIKLARQIMTRRWWDGELSRFTPCVSAFVLDEAARGDAEAAGRRLAAIGGFKVLALVPEAVSLAKVYHSRLKIPGRAELDAMHLAMAVCHGMDYLVSWNCLHIAGARHRRLVEGIALEHGYRSPVVCTPLEMLEREP